MEPEGIIGVLTTQRKQMFHEVLYISLSAQRMRHSISAFLPIKQQQCTQCDNKNVLGNK